MLNFFVYFFSVYSFSRSLSLSLLRTMCVTWKVGSDFIFTFVFYAAYALMELSGRN